MNYNIKSDPKDREEFKLPVYLLNMLEQERISRGMKPSQLIESLILEGLPKIDTYIPVPREFKDLEKKMAVYYLPIELLDKLTMKLEALGYREDKNRSYFLSRIIIEGLRGNISIPGMSTINQKEEKRNYGYQDNHADQSVESLITV